MEEKSVKHLLDVLIAQLKRSGKEGTASAYQSAVCSALNVLSSDMPASGLFSPEGIYLYEKRLFSRGLCKNTVSFYMRMLRAIYNKGIELKLCTEQPKLFARAYTGLDNTPKRAVPPHTFGLLQKLCLANKKNLSFACDLFLLSFSLQGISFVDLSYLRKSDLKGSILTYNRAKTGSPITVAVCPLAEQIIERYTLQTRDSPYLLPIIKKPDEDTRLQYKSALRTYNRRLKKLAKMIGLEENLTSYVARHSWATIAWKENMPMGLISQALGHGKEETTRIYLAGFDYSDLFHANEIVLRAANLVTSCDTIGNMVFDEQEKNVSRLRSERHFPSTNITEI